MQNPISKKIVQKEGFFPSDGRWLFYRCWYTTPQKGEVLVLHGASEHSGRYHELGNLFASHGFNFYTFDFTGHGRSEGKRGHIYCFEEYLVDIANFYGFLRVYRNMKVPFLIGHSMGGLLATLFAAWGVCPVKGLVLSAPLFGIKLSISHWERLVLKFLAFLYPTWYMSSRFEPKYLSHDMEIVEDYLSDPLIQRHVTSRWVYENLRAMKFLPHIVPHVNLPCLIWHGEEDQIADIEMSKVLFQKFPHPDREFYVIPNGYHELFNEIGSNKIIAKTIEWLLAKSQSKK